MILFCEAKVNGVEEALLAGYTVQSPTQGGCTRTALRGPLSAMDHDETAARHNKRNSQPRRRSHRRYPRDPRGLRPTWRTRTKRKKRRRKRRKKSRQCSVVEKSANAALSELHGGKPHVCAAGEPKLLLLLLRVIVRYYEEEERCL
jgi:hypothetical protein